MEKKFTQKKKNEEPQQKNLRNSGVDVIYLLYSELSRPNTSVFPLQTPL